MAGLFVLLAVEGTLLFLVSGVSDRFANVENSARIVDFSGLAGASAFGLVRAISDAATVVSSNTF